MNMSEDQFQSRLTELMQNIRGLPEERRTSLELMADEVRDRQTEITEAQRDMEDALATWRLYTKYLIFSIEAAARERAAREAREA